MDENKSVTAYFTPLPITISAITLYTDNSYGTKQTWDHLYKKGDFLYVQANGTGGDPAVKNTKTVNLSSSVTNPTGIEIQLTETSPNSGVYRRSFQIDQALVNTSKREGYNEVAVVETEDEGVGKGFLNKFPSNVIKSRACGSGIQSLHIPPCSIDFIKAGGYETIKISTEDKSTTCFVKNQADLLLYIGHGTSADTDNAMNEGLIKMEKGENCFPNDIGDNWEEDLDCVILFACSVLDIRDGNGDHRNGMIKKKSRYAYGPGAEWAKIKGPRYLLGFNGLAPKVIENDGDKVIYDWQKLWWHKKDNDKQEIEAWEMATYERFDKNPKQFYNACLIDTKNGYYYWQITKPWWIWLTSYESKITEWKGPIPQNKWNKTIPSTMFMAALACPADLHIYDPDGNHVGLNNSGGVDINIPGAEYITSEDSDTKIILIPNADMLKDYRVEVKGSGEGVFKLGVLCPDSSNNIIHSAQYLDVPVNTTTVGKLTLNQDRDLSLKIDNDGDGKTDKARAPDIQETFLTLLIGSISITSTPAGASIFLDGTDTKTITPAILTNIIPGTYTIQLIKNDYENWHRQTMVTAGLTTNISATLTKNGTTGTLLTISPATTRVGVENSFNVDIVLSNAPEFDAMGAYLSFDPQVLEVISLTTGSLTQGGSELVRQFNNSSGMIDYAVRLTSGTAQGTGTILTIKLKAKGSGTTTLNFDFNPPRITEILNGIATVPFSTQIGTIQVEAIDMPQTPAFGTLSVTSFPTGASILIDGVNKGTTPAELSLQPGSYTLSLAMMYYSTYTTTFSVGTGLTTYIPATLTATISTHLKITPATKNIVKGEEFLVDVAIASVRKMITGKLHLSFNPDVLELQGIGTGTFPGGDNAAKQWDNKTGKIDYFVGLLTGSATGSGVICTLKFKAKAGGKSSVVFDFDELNNRLTRLKNADGNDIPFNKEEAAYYVFGSVKIKLQDTTTMADEGSTYQCIAICDNNLEMDVTGSTTFTASGGGSFTQNAFLAKYSGTYTIQGEYAGLIGTTTVVILPGTVCALIYVSGDNQAGSCALTLKEPFVVRAVDKYDNLCEGAGIIWEIFSSPSGAAGCLSSTKTTTNILGMASSTLTLGAEPPGTWTIRAVLPGQMDLPCTFTANSWRRFGNIAGFCLLDLGSGRLGTSSQIRVKIEQTGATATISEDSSFIFRDIPVGTYTLDFDSRGASSKVVSNVRISPAQFEPSTSIGNITLLSGDINNDGKINLEDWPRFVDAFFKQKGCTNWEEIKQADFNQDNKVNDEDFIVLRDNFGKLTEDMVMNAPSLAKAADMGAGSVELSLNLDTLDGLRVGNIIYLKVYIRNATNLLGAEVHLSFDPKVLEVVNVPAGIMQSQGMNARGFSVSDNLIQQGDYFAGDVWELMNKVDNISGKIDYSVGVLKAQKARDEGILAIVPFRIKSSGASSDIGFDFKEQENRQTLFVKRRYIGVEEEAIDTIPHVRSEGMIINIPYVNPDDIRVYPNPVDAGKCTEATFDYLPAGRQVTLKIYNVAGELVFEKSGMNIIRWGLRNGDGDTIASGVYFYYLRDESGVIKQGKIGVMR